MKDHIEREAVLELLRKWADGYSYIEIEAALAIRGITAIPAADVKPVVRGEWVDGLEIPKAEREKHPYVYLHGEKHCSVCYKEAYYDTDYGQQLFDFCPNCGADMRGGQ